MGSVYPQFAFDPTFDLAIAVLVFVGGIGTLSGPVLGALVLIPLQQYFYLQFGNANLYLIAYGVLFILILRLLPGGIVPGVTSAWRSRLVARARARHRRHRAERHRTGRRGAGRRQAGRRAEGQSMSVIQVTDLKKSYGGIHALAGCSMTFEDKAINGLIGPNGSGKTTLFNVITGYETADSGQVSLRGQDITNAKPDKVFEQGIGRTFQITRIFPRLTVLENVHVAAQRPGIRRAGARVGLDG